MAPTPVRPPRLLALSDLHVGYRENRAIVENLRPGSGDDWLIVAGDVGVQFARQSQVKVWEVDENSSIGTAISGFTDDFAKAAVDSRYMLDDLDDADFGDLTRIGQQFAAGLAHLVAANPEELGLTARRALRELPA